MTLDERKITIAYADMLRVGDLIQHVLDIGAYELLSNTGKARFADAELLLGSVRSEFSVLMAEHTDFGPEDKKEDADGGK